MLHVGNMSPDKRAIHALNRLAFGPRPGDVQRVNQIGVERYIREQLNPESIPEPHDLVRRVAALRTLHMTPVELFETFQLPVRRAKGNVEAQKAARRRSQVIMQQAVEARLMRAIHGPRQLQEVMTAFWFNHFNVFAGKGLCHLWVGAYEQEAIRPHTMANFRSLLGATAKHPAMLFYLDNWQNTGPNSPGRRGRFDGINENYAREVMELHTLGVNGGYTQADVIALAHILTGWGLMTLGALMRMRARRMAAMGRRPRRRWRRLPPPGHRDEYGFYFNPRRHDTADQVFLGRIYHGARGMAEGEAALDTLAYAPATARHLSFELARHFVADDPPPALVARMAERYEQTRGNIRDVLETLFFSAEFWDERCYGARFKTPYEYVISAVRLTGVNDITNYRPLFGTMALMGMAPYRHQTPDGYHDTQEAWLNPDAMMMRLSFATALGVGRLPLLAPPFETVAGARAFRAAYKKNGAGASAAMMHSRTFRRMEPPHPAELEAALGGTFSANTRRAIEAGPARLRAALVLGSPEFMTC
jgi:uncharacterized protein (DUF1800 family)